MTIAPTFNDAEPAPIEMDPRPCELCGCTIDRHHRVDTEEGPEFFCIDWRADELTLDELERRAELRIQEEVAAAMTRLEAMDDPSKRPPADKPRPRRTPKTVVDAFLYVARNHDADYVTEWLANHPQDIETLTKLWETKNGLS